MALIDTFLNIADGWRDVFSQDRVYRRVARQAIASLCSYGPSTVSQSICLTGRDKKDWTAEYRIHSKRFWDESDIFEPVLQTGLELIKGGVIAVGYDDTRVKKTGRKIASARWHYDPLSPPFRANLVWGLRFLQASLLMPNYRTDASAPPRGIPVRFTEVPHVKKPGKLASQQERAKYRVESKIHNLSQSFIKSAVELRKTIDEYGYINKHLLLVGDGSFCNQTCFRAVIERSSLIARTRKDAKLCFRDESPNKQRLYAKEKFTPEEIRLDEAIPWQQARIYHGGRFRTIRYKVVNRVLWQRGCKTRSLKLFIVAPTAYRTTKKGKKYYRKPAYLLSTSLELEDSIQLQSYFDRWQIEVNFRDQKQVAGLGQAQVRNPESVKRQPAFIAASYSILLLASHITFGTKRGPEYTALPKWRRNAKRPSCLDIVNRLRLEFASRDDIKHWLEAPF